MGFEPWVGDKYRDGGIFGCRLMVLGESHYGNQEVDYSAFTRDVVQRWGIERRDRFFTSLAKTLLSDAGRGWLPNGPRHDCYQSIAFYNYIQELVGPGPRVRPTESMWAAARAPLRKTLEVLVPEAIVVLGKELWWNLTTGSEPLFHAKAHVGEHEIRQYLLPDGKAIVATMIAHPSSFGYQFAAWQPRVLTLRSAASERVTLAGG